MRRDAVAVVAVVVLLFALEAGTFHPRGHTGLETAVLADPRVSQLRAVDASPVAWHPLFQGEGSASHLFVDPARNRVTFGAALGPWYQQENRLLTVDWNGTVLGNLSWNGAPFAVDPVTGGVFQSWSDRTWTPYCRCDREVWSLDPGAAAWRPLGDGSPRREPGGMGYDPRAGRTVLSNGETWSFNGTTSRWDLRSLNNGTDAIQAVSLVFDDRAGRFVVSGFLTSDRYWYPHRPYLYDFKNDTWTPITMPSTAHPFWLEGLTYNRRADRVIAFVAYPFSDPFNETWSYDLTNDTWTRMTPERSPPSLEGPSIAYDPRTDRMVLFGGEEVATVNGSWMWSLSNETWIYDLTNDTWSPSLSLTTPPGRVEGGMAYDPRSGRMILFGGYGVEGSYNDTWSYDPANDTWTAMRHQGSLPAPYAPALSYDASLDRMLMFGGDAGGTWMYDSVADEWTLADFGTPPAPTGIVYDSESNRVELFGDVSRMVSGLMTVDTEVWSFDPDAATWFRLAPPPPGPTTYTFGVVYDAGSDRTLLFGGQDYNGTASNDTWAYDDNSNIWERRNSESSPSPRSGAAMAYDAGSDRVVLFGGYGYVDVNGTPRWTQFNDTWLYDYAADTWTLRNPTNAPARLLEPIMAYDSRSDRVLLLGGSTTSAWMAPETWSYDTANDTWTRMAPPMGSAFWAQPAAAYDATSDRLLVFGGGTNETWSYDPDLDNWTSMTTDRAPCPRAAGSLVYDDALDRAFLFGGWSSEGGWRSVMGMRAIDPVSGAVVAGPWPLQVYGAMLAFGRDSIYAGDGGIRIINRTSGEVERTIDPPPTGSLQSFALDPTEGWLVGVWYNASDGTMHAVRVNLTRGTFDVLPALTESTPAVSADGSTLFVCTTRWRVDPSTALEAYWLANGSLRYQGYCAGGVRNPVTGVEALVSGGLSANGHVFESLPVASVSVAPWLVGTFQRFDATVWTEDGTALAGIADFFGSNRDLFQVGVWTGTPAVAHPPSVVKMDAGRWNLAVTSVSGFNATTMSVFVDGAPWSFTVSGPVIGTFSVELGPVPDGRHTIRIAGWDLVGQRLDETFPWVMDRTAPEIRVLSSLNPTAAPYSLYGVVDDASLWSVRVNGIDASLDDMNWSSPLKLIIGNNSFRVDAMDMVGLKSNVSGIIRYWPLHDRVVTNATGHYSVATPPDWTPIQVSAHGGAPYLTLIESASGSAAASFSVATLADPYANDTYACVRTLALYEAQIYSGLGMKIRAPGVSQDEVDGHIAASFRATTSAWGNPATVLVTIVASAAWHREYILTMDVPDARASANPETRAWILEGFHILSAPLVPTPEPIESWPFLGLGITGAVCAAGVAWELWSERRARRRRAPTGGLTAP